MGRGVAARSPRRRRRDRGLSLDPVAAAQSAVLRGLGYSPADPHLLDSPPRIARFLRAWHTMGKEPPRLTVFPNEEGYDQVIAVGGTRFYSMCAHHWLPFTGTATVGYIPNGQIVGLSKLPRVVEHFAHRFQTQERMTMQIADYLWKALRPRALGVVLRAEHLCMSMRGIERPGHSTITSDLRGAFRLDAASRAEFLRITSRH